MSSSRFCTTVCEAVLSSLPASIRSSSSIVMLVSQMDEATACVAVAKRHFKRVEMKPK